MAEKSFDDNDQSVYKTHILYYLPSDANCSKLMGTLETHPLYDELFLQDVSKLRQRPPWLDGVPILVCKKDSQAYKGQHIQNYMKSYQSDEFLPAGACTGGWSSYDDGESSMEKRFNTLHDPCLFDLEEEGGQQTQPVPAQGGGGGGSAQMSEKQQRKQQSEVEAQQRAQQMMNVRQQQDQMLQARSKGSTSLAPTPRNAFAGDADSQPVVRHPPPTPSTMHQRSAETRTPHYGQPQHYQYEQHQQPQPQHQAQVPQFYAQQQQPQPQPQQQQQQQQQYYAQQPQQQQQYYAQQPQQQQQYYAQQPQQPQQQQQYYAQQPQQQQYYEQGYY
jgi:hypothetical protein